MLSACTLLATPASAAEEQSAEAGPTQAEIEAWLSARALPDTRSDSASDGDEAPPRPPRAQGLVVESGVGALGQFGPLKNVTPTAPWFHLQVGYEFLSWLMLFAEGDLAVMSTRYANPPPDPRAFTYYGFGGGLRFTVRPGDRFGIYLQGSIGASRASSDVLAVYGYVDADELAPYYGGELGLEWYMVSPHYAVALHGGARNYDQSLSRLRSSETALAWVSGLSLRYAF